MHNEVHPIEGLDRPRVWMVPLQSDPEATRGRGATAAPSGPRVWGLSAEERIRRTLAAATGGDGTGDGNGRHELLFACDLIVDEKVVAALRQRPGTLLVDDAGRAVAACVVAEQRGLAAAEIRAQTSGGAPELHRVRAEELVDTYDPLLRKAVPPVVVRVTPANTAELEARLFRASYKGVTDFVTKWVWPRPARAVTHLLARAGVRPNTVTAWSWLLVVAATVLFARGEYGWGLAAAWSMTFLDTVDGKLARVTLQSSRLGHVLDHGLDIVHPPFWYAAWALSVDPAPLWWGMAVWWVIGGYVAGRLLEGLFMLVFRIETHSWRPLDSWFRTITARRNPNLVLLSLATAAGEPALGFGAVALWTAISLAFHVVRLVQAGADRARGRAVEPWYLRQRMAGAR